jgi:hypothetical protein
MPDLNMQALVDAKPNFLVAKLVSHNETLGAPNKVPETFFVNAKPKKNIRLDTAPTVGEPILTLCTANGLIPMSETEIMRLQVVDSRTASHFLRNFCQSITYHTIHGDSFRCVLKTSNSEGDKARHQRTTMITKAMSAERESVYINTARSMWEDMASDADLKFKPHAPALGASATVLQPVVDSNSMTDDDQAEVRTQSDIYALEPKTSQSASAFLRRFCTSLTVHRSEADEFRATLKSANLHEDKIKYSVCAEINVGNLHERESKYITTAYDMWLIWAQIEEDKL